MISQVLSIVVLLGFASAVEHATSYISYSSHPAELHQAQPLLLKSAPVAYHAPALIKAAPIAYHAPALIKSAPIHQEVYAHPQYNFKYGVQDSHTQDIKSQEEQRDGDVVKGSYSLLQPDGVTRTVHYTADKNGFNADVQYSGHAGHPQQVHKAIVGKAVLAAPVYHQSAPVYNYH